MDTAEAERLDGVLAVLTVVRRPALADTSDGELRVLQDDRVHFRGQLIGAVVAETRRDRPARSRSGARRLRRGDPHDTELARRPPRPVRARAGQRRLPDRHRRGRRRGGARARPRSRSTQSYSTPIEHNNPMEPHAARALGRRTAAALTLHDSTQGVHAVRETLARCSDSSAEQIRVVAPHVGGGFGSKGVAARPRRARGAGRAARRGPAGEARGDPAADVLARRLPHPDVQHIRLGADGDGRLTALCHEAFEQTAASRNSPSRPPSPSR